MLFTLLLINFASADVNILLPIDYWFLLLFERFYLLVDHKNIKNKENITDLNNKVSI